MNIDNVREEVVADDCGTVRVSDHFGTIAIYTKIGDNQWHVLYVDPKEQEWLVAPSAVSDVVAGLHRVVYAPKTVA